MLIGIDGNEANVQNRVGSNIYAFEVIWHLFRLNTSDSYSIYLRSAPLSDLPPEKENWQYKVFGPQKFWTQFALPLKLYLEKDKPEVFFTPGHYAPRFCPVPSIISILDTSYLLFPNYFRKSDLIQLKSWSSYSIRNAKKIITISNSTKNDIVKFYQVKENNIKVIYPGYDSKRFHKNLGLEKSETILNKYKVKKPYILFVGTIQPRKNLLRLLTAFKDISKKHKKINLVIVGKQGWLYDEILETVKDEEIERKIVIAGYAEDNDLPIIYKEAACFILPSLYEGFGIPVVEAMAVGCPVIVSNTSSLPEVVGDAGIKIEPKDVQSIFDGIDTVLNFTSEQKNNIIEKGYGQVTKFSWQNCAEEILKILRSSKTYEDHH